MGTFETVRGGARVRLAGLAVTAVLGATLAAAVGAAGHDAMAAGGGGGPEGSFAEAFARSRLVVVAVVEAAPPGDPGFRLAVESSLKGDVGSTVTFTADAASVALTKGSRIVLLAMDPTVLDFRGTVVLAVAPDGTIDPDGLTGVPGSVVDLVAGYGEGGQGGGAPDGPGASDGPGTATAAPTAVGDVGSGPGFPWIPLLVLALVAVGAATALAIRERRRP